MVTGEIILVFLCGVVCGLVLAEILPQRTTMPRFPVGPNGAKVAFVTKNGFVTRPAPDLKELPPPEQGGIALGRSWRAQRELLERGTMEGPPPRDSLQKLEEKVERIKAGA